MVLSQSDGERTTQQILKPEDGLGHERGWIAPQLEDVVFKLRSGEVSPIVETADGVHVVRVIEHRPAGLLPLDEELRKDISNRLRQQRFSEGRKQLIDELRSQALIYIEPD